MTRIVLVEDDEVFRIGLSTTLKQLEDVQVVGIATDGAEALTIVADTRPDLVLMDMGLPVLSGIAATKKIKVDYPDIKILVLTSHAEAALVDQMMEAGADGFCLKGISTERLHTLIREVAQGTFWIDSGISQHVKRYFHTPLPAEKATFDGIPAEGMALLTEREREVLALIAKGHKNQEIANLLFISPGTVRVHVHAILSKLNVKDRTQAALFVVRGEVFGGEV